MRLLLLVMGLVIVIRSEPRSIEVTRASSSPGAEAGSRGIPGSASEASRAPEVDWKTLRELDYETGEMTPALEALVGTEIWVPGFMVPLERDGRHVLEFLLVPYVGACVHTPAPPPNQLIHVRTRPGEPVEVEWWDPIWVRAELELDPSESAYGEANWSMVARSVEPYDY